jgi:capsular polysaccharide biosynthesis protein
MYSTVTQPERIQIIHSLPVPEDSGVKVEVIQPGPGEPVRSVLNLSWHARFQTLELATRPSVNDCPQDLHALPTSRGSLLRHLRDVATGYAALARPPVELEAPFMDFRAVSPNNISHLLQDIIPLVLHAQRVLGCKVTLLTRRIAPTFRELVEAFGIPIVDTSRRVRGIEVCAHACRRLTAYAPPWFDMPSLLFLPDIYRDWDFDAKESPESVFIARRGDRALKNHAEIEAMLVGLGFKTIYMEDYDARNKMGILKHTRRIVAVHGAGLAPAVFGRRLEQVVELMPPHAFNEWFASFLGAKVSDYKMVLSEHDPA